MTVAMLTLLSLVMSGGAAGATRLEVAGHPFGEPRVQVLESQPPQFDLVFRREMPTPGFELRVDSIETEGGRIVARITELAPEGMVAQVITPTELRLSLGAVAPGRYLLEIHTRRGEDGVYLLADALVLTAG